MPLLVRVEPALALEAVARAIAPFLPKPTALVRLRSRHLDEADWAFIEQSWQSGRTLLLDPGPAPLTVVKLVSRLRGRGSNAGGLCVLLRDVPRELSRDSVRIMHIDAGDAILRLEAPPIERRALGRAPTGLSFKDLCLLHHRDDGPIRPYRSAPAIFESEAPIRWQDLQVLLRSEPDVHMLLKLEGLRKDGRVSQEQCELAEAAVFFLRQERPMDVEQARQGDVEPSIHALCWWHAEYRPAVAHTPDLYRGQRHSHWPQIPSLLRPRSDGEPPDLGLVVERVTLTQAFMDALARREQKWFGLALGDEERLAIAQHYEMPTPLLDYSRSFAVAAFFATGSGDPSAVSDGAIGIVYRLSPHKLAADAMQAAPSDELDGPLGLMRAAGVRPGLLRMIEPRLPEQDDRIGRQQGVFVDGFTSRDLQQLSGSALYFRQHAGACFEDERLGITRARLLDPDARLQRLANRVQQRPRRPPPLAGGLRSLRLAGDAAYHGQDSWLYSNLGKGQRLVESISQAARRADPPLWQQLRTLIERHFEHARVVVQTEEHGLLPQGRVVTAANGDSHRLDDVDSTLFDVAQLVGLDGQAFVDRMARLRPSREPTPEELAPLHRGFGDRTGEPRERLARAAAALIIGFEYMRRVRGALADQFLTLADQLLREP